MNLQEALDICVKKTRKNTEKIGNDLREYLEADGYYFQRDKENYIPLSNIFNWTQSFFTGMAYISYKITKDEHFLKWINSFYQDYYNKVFVTPLDTMHDLGFLYIPYAVCMYKLTGDENMKAIGVKAADELAKRYDPKGGYIRAWGRVDNIIPDYVDDRIQDDNFFTQSRGLAIVDCMMNIPLLFWATEVTKNPFYKKIASSYADLVLKYWVRDDDSICHAYRFSEETGEPITEECYCGYGRGSHWARGTTWAIYGFAIAYRYTGKKEYLDTSIRLARKYVTCVEDDMMPVLDFRTPESEMKGGRKSVYDTSAAAVFACGVYEICDHTKVDDLKEAADKMLEVMCETYVDSDEDKPGIMSHQNGNMSYTSFGDYFLMEALSKKLYNFECIW